MNNRVEARGKAGPRDKREHDESWSGVKSVLGPIAEIIHVLVADFTVVRTRGGATNAK